MSSSLIKNRIIELCVGLVFVRRYIESLLVHIVCYHQTVIIDWRIEPEVVLFCPPFRIMDFNARISSLVLLIDADSASPEPAPPNIVLTSVSALSRSPIPND